jgi:hypothetical protein
MNKDAKSSDNSSWVYVTCWVLSVLLFASYIFIYQYAPLGDSFNDSALNLITTLASLFVAAFATAIYLHYHPEDRPRRVWNNLMIGSWLWFTAELLWGALDYIYGEVATPGVPDAFWVGGFVFFTIAFYWQYLLVVPSQQKRIRNIALGAWVLSLVLPLAGFLSAQAFTFADYINYFYPIADFAVGIAGLWLIFIFRGGALVRPWVGLVVFGISDLFYAWAEQTGVYAWSSENSNLLTLAIDSSYLAAYLILGLGFVGHWVLINYGLRRNQR